MIAKVYLHLQLLLAGIEINIVEKDDGVRRNQAGPRKRIKAERIERLTVIRDGDVEAQRRERLLASAFC